MPFDRKHILVVAETRMDIDAAIVETQGLRENKRQIAASQSLLQAFRAAPDLKDSQAEKLVQVLTQAIREPLEEQIALQREQIAALKQQVEYLTQRVNKELWP